jgi:hypothetical protein
MKSSNKIILLFSVIIFILFFELNSKSNFDIEWSQPEIISDNIKPYSGMPSICSKNKKVLFTWIQKDDFRSTNSEVLFRELPEKNGSNTNNISNIRSIYFSPVILCDKVGSFHCVIGGNMNPRLIDYFQPCTEVFYLKNQNGDWSIPKIIYQVWDSKNKAQISGWKMKIDKENILHLLLNVTDSSGKSLVHLKIKDSIISFVNKISVRCSYFDFIIDEQNIVHLAYIGVVPKQEFDQNSVFYMYSLDQGVTFSKPVIIQKSGIYSAYEVVIIKDNKRNIHIIWGKDLDNDSYSDAIFHSLSEDGSSWLMPKNIIRRGIKCIFSPKVIIDTNNNQHLVWWGSNTIPLNETKAYYSKWNGENWTPEVKIFDNARNLALCIDDAGFLHIVMEIFKKFEKTTSIYHSVTTKSVYNYDKK